MNKIKAQYSAAAIFWILTAVTAAAVFMFSSDSGEKSAELSEGFLAWLTNYIYAVIPHNLLRKIAHFTEFAALGFFLSGAIRFTFGKKNLLFSLIPCTLYAVSDEIHQYFVPERACRLLDVFIDACGSAVGAAIFIGVFILIEKISCKKLKSTDKR